MLGNYSNNNSNLSRRELLAKLTMAGLSFSMMPILGLGKEPAPRKPLKKARPRLNFWGTGTLDIGKGWAVAEELLDVKIEFEDNGNDPGPVITRLIDHRESQVRHLSGLQGGAERELAKAGVALPWDLKKIPSFSRIWPWAQSISYTVVDGEHIGIPSVVNADSMIYLPELTGTIDSYAAVFEDRFRGHTSMEDAWINSVIFTAIYLKESKGVRIADPGNLTERELDEVMRFLEDCARRGQFRKLWRGWKDGVDLITSKQVWVMTGWEPIVYEAIRQGINAAYAIPREGYEGWSNDVILHPGVLHDGLVDIAHRFIEWELSGFYGARLVSDRGYVVPTDATASYAELHPEDFPAKKVVSVVEGVKRKFFAMKGQVYWQNVRPQNYRLYEERWSRFRSLV